MIIGRTSRLAFVKGYGFRPGPQRPSRAVGALILMTIRFRQVPCPPLSCGLASTGDATTDEHPRLATVGLAIGQWLIRQLGR